MKIKGVEIGVVQGDITQADTEAIVNAANNRFFMGGGVAAAIKRRGGDEIEEEAVGQGPVEVGKAVVSGGGRLKAKYVIHAATMKMDFRTSPEIIRKATASALFLAQKKKIASVAFCALGCGVGGFSYEAAAKIMGQEVFRYLREVKNPALKKIVFYLYSAKAFQIFEKNFVRYLQHLVKKVNQGPFLTVDGIIEYQGGVVLVERSNPPFGWALPGGFVDAGESVEEAVAREVKEETGLDFMNFKQFKVYSQPDRDPRFHTVSVVFSGQGRGRLKADSDAKAAEVFPYNHLPESIAFDHRRVIEDYLETI